VQLHPSNNDAWDIYCRVSDQIDSYAVGKDKYHTLLRTEAVKAMIDLVDPADPLETYDRVILIHKVRYPE
jgi:hypothetical protein